MPIQYQGRHGHFLAGKARFLFFKIQARPRKGQASGLGLGGLASRGGLVYWCPNLQVLKSQDHLNYLVTILLRNLFKAGF